VIDNGNDNEPFPAARQPALRETWLLLRPHTACPDRRLLLDDLGERDRVAGGSDPNDWLLADLGIRDEDDVSRSDFRETVALLTETLDFDLECLSFSDRWLIRVGVGRRIGPLGSRSGL
jgi:hypothetical protein